MSRQKSKNPKNDFNWTEFWQSSSPVRIKIASWYGHWVCLRLFEGLNDVETFLEMGGGPGYLTKLISQKMGFKATLIENDPAGYRLFKKISNFGQYVFEDFFKYQPEEKFDLVFSYGVIEHYPKRKKRLEVIKLHKKLSKKYVAIFVPKSSFLVRTFCHYPEERGFEKLYTRKELEAELKDAGLKISRFAQNLHVIGFLARI